MKQKLLFDMHQEEQEAQEMAGEGTCWHIDSVIHICPYMGTKKAFLSLPAPGSN